MWMVVFGPRKLWFKFWTSGHRRLSPILSSGATGLATVSCWTQGFCWYSCCSFSYILSFFGWVLALHLMDVSIILTFDLIFMISCITLCCSDRNFFLDGQFRCFVVSSDYLFVWCKTTSRGHSIHCFQLVCLVNGCYACCPEMYWHVSTSFDLFYCFLVDVIVYFSTLSNVSRWSFPHFNLL